MYVKLENGIPVEWPLDSWQIRVQNPGLSLPEYISNEVASELGYGVLVEDSPRYDPEFQNIIEIAPILKDGKYYQSYEITEKYTKEEKQKILDQRKKDFNQQEAKKLLLESDWVEYPSTSDTTRNPHLTNLNEWLDYRVALRAIAVNPSETVEFPVKPTEQWSN